MCDGRERRVAHLKCSLIAMPFGFIFVITIQKFTGEIGIEGILQRCKPLDTWVNIKIALHM